MISVADTLTLWNSEANKKHIVTREVGLSRICVYYHGILMEYVHYQSIIRGIRIPPLKGYSMPLEQTSSAFKR